MSSHDVTAPSYFARLSFRKWLEAHGEGDLPRVPWSGKMQRRVEVPGMEVPEPYKSQYNLKDRKPSTHIFQATHRYLDPEMRGATIMVTQDDGKVVKFLTDFGVVGSEPKQYFIQKFEPIVSPGQN
jgi:hypothetical protein